MPIPKGWSEFKPEDIKVSKGKGGVYEISYTPAKPNSRSPKKDLKAKRGKGSADKRNDNPKPSLGK
jgi:hypothetical protein